MNAQPKNSFSYAYSGKQQDEVKQIREKYLKTEKAPEKPNDKMDALRKLDKKVELIATVAATLLGVGGLLLLGVGLTCVLEGWGWSFVPGIFIGIIGLIGISSAYPFHRMMLKRLREKYAPEILQLSDELLQ